MNIEDYIKKSKNHKSVYYKTSKFMRVIAFNMQYKKSIDDEQINQLINLNSDIMLLSECYKYIGEVLYNYNELISEKSHCGYMKIFIHKNICIDNWNYNIETIKLDGCVLSVVDTIFGKMILGTMHLAPFKQNYIYRENTIIKINEFCHDFNCPCIIGGDTNMRPYEKYTGDFEDAWEKCSNSKYYLTWPNRDYVDKVSFTNLRHIQYDCRFDKFFIKNCIYTRFKTINTKNSDHLMIAIDIILKKNNCIDNKKLIRSCGCKCIINNQNVEYIYCKTCQKILDTIKNYNYKQSNKNILSYFMN